MTVGKIRVLFLQAQPNFVSITAVHNLIMRHLDRSRFEVHIACVRGPGGGVPEALVPLATIPDSHLRLTNFGPTVFHKSKREVVVSAVAGGIPAALSLAGLVRYVKRQRVDIIHLSEKPRDSVYGVLLGRATGAKTVFHHHALPGDWMSGRAYWAMDHADAHLAVSDFVARSLVSKRGYAPDRVHVARNGLDLSSWDCSLDGNSTRAELSVPPEVPLLAVISRLVPQKGHRELIEALARVRQRTPNFRLLVVGDDDPTAYLGRSWADELRALTRDLGLDQQVIFAGHRSDVRNILAACDVFAMPSIGEALGLVYLEAMAMKKPVVALRNGGTPEAVDDGHTGLLSEPGDIEQLAGNLQALIERPELRKEMGEHGRRRVESLFTAERMAREVEDAYRLISAGEPSRLSAMRAKAR